MRVVGHKARADGCKYVVTRSHARFVTYIRCVAAARGGARCRSVGVCNGHALSRSCRRSIRYILPLEESPPFPSYLRCLCAGPLSLLS